MGVSKNGGFPQQPWVFLLKMIILGCFGTTTIEGNNHKRMLDDTLDKHQGLLELDVFSMRYKVIQIATKK